MVRSRWVLVTALAGASCSDTPDEGDPPASGPKADELDTGGIETDSEGDPAAEAVFPPSWPQGGPAFPAGRR